MKCPVCVENNLKSTIDIGTSLRTSSYSKPYYDEEGVYHNHNPNKTHTNMTCSNGHKFTVLIGYKCPGCDWGWSEEIKNNYRTNDNSGRNNEVGN